METKRKVDFFHSIRNRQRHVSTGVDKCVTSIDAGAAGKICGPLRFSLVECDRFAGVIQRCADDRGFGKSIKELSHSSEVVGVDRIGIVVETANEFVVRSSDELVSSATWTNAFLTYDDLYLWKGSANGLFTFDPVSVDVNEDLIRFWIARFEDAEGVQCLIDSFVRGNDCRNVCHPWGHKRDRSISASTCAPARFG